MPADLLTCLSFEHAWAVRGVVSEFPPYEFESPIPHSSIFNLRNSRWLGPAIQERLRVYPRRANSSPLLYHHYLVLGHDNYYEIIATGFKEEKIFEPSDAELNRLIEDA